MLDKINIDFSKRTSDGHNPHVDRNGALMSTGDLKFKIRFKKVWEQGVTFALRTFMTLFR